MPTLRERVAECLSQGFFDLDELAARLGLPISEVLDHLGHVKKSVRPPRRFRVEPAECRDCGFVFKDRARLGPPGRCPKCKSGQIKKPRYTITG